MNWRAGLCLTLLLVSGIPVVQAGANLPATGTVEVLFTPWDDAEGALVRTINGAKQTIHVQAFLLTSRQIGRALAGAPRRHVKVRILADRDQAVNGKSEVLQDLHELGVPIWLEGRYANAHNKVMLIDAESQHPVVVTGSYNFTFSAQARNAENLLLLRGNMELAQAYLKNWQRHQADALAYAEVFR